MIVHFDPLTEPELDGKLGKGFNDYVVALFKKSMGALSLDTTQCTVQDGMRKKIVQLW